MHARRSVWRRFARATSCSAGTSGGHAGSRRSGRSRQRRPGSTGMLVDGADEVGTQAGAGRVLLRFLDTASEARTLGETRVPSGTTVFDAASWNGIAIDSTCGGHGTCKKCKVRVVDGAIGVSDLDPRAFSTDQLADGWRLACRAGAHDDLVVEVPPLQTRPKAALAGVGRHV